MSLSLHNLSIPYLPKNDSGIWNCELTFEKGKYYHIKASSGKGKTTLIHTLYGLQKKYNGKFLIENIEAMKLSDNEWSDIRANKITIVFQDLKLFEQHTAFENIEVKRALTNSIPSEKINEWATRLGVAHTLNQTVNTLSYGERQRIAIIRSLMQPFDYLLLDEPFSHLDNENIAVASALIIEEVKKNNACLVLADLEDDNHFPYHQKILL